MQSSSITNNQLQQLDSKIDGELFWKDSIRKIYATDASAYRELPLAVAYPKSQDDIIELVSFASEHGTSLIPRTAGTSLAGQVVGPGIVVDVSRYLNEILEVNEQERWVRVQPGVVRDELNMHLRQYGLYFGPETSTANRAMIGGMIGNNSCGSNSIVYGSTRENLITLQTVLSDGSVVQFGPLEKDEVQEKSRGERGTGSLEQKLYSQITDLLAREDIREEIDREFPKKGISRRNTGYAVDLLKDTEPFVPGAEPFNFCKLIAGSEGTLAFVTEAKLKLEPLPKPHIALVCAHFDNIYDSLLANLVGLEFNPTASELIDHYILECTKDNLEQKENRFFVEGEPKAILIVEIRKDSYEEALTVASDLVTMLKQRNLGYHHPIIQDEDATKVWQLRKAGLGLLGSIPGDEKSVPVIEDTAVDPEDLPEYIKEFNEILDQRGLYCVHYAHAATGELHLRPIINLKTKEGNKLFRDILDDVAQLVKKYKGSLSGEHGDGRLRGEFIPYMIGDANYQLLKEIKHAWDPDGIFNPGKIVDTPPMNTYLRYKPGQETPNFNTALNFDSDLGLMRAVEKCNGVGACRKTELTGGTMCPSYMATRNEKDTTRARANILREVLTHSEKNNRFDSEEIKEVMDLCLSCKGCKSECPSNVDVAKLKAEFQHQYHKSNKIPWRTKMMADVAGKNALASKIPSLYNWTMVKGPLAALAKSILGVAAKRSLPKMARQTLLSWYKENRRNYFGVEKPNKGKVYLFNDEFTNYYDVEIGITAIKLLTKLGYEVEIPEHVESGRASISKGLLDRSKELATTNIKLLENLVSHESPLIGLEPSAILSFRDEYPDLVSQDLREKARQIAQNTYTIEEFLSNKVDVGEMTSKQFESSQASIKLHGHCHQKALSSQTPAKKILSLPKNYEVQIIPSGCCGMAGSFGYEKEHYDISMKIGELVLFPAVRNQTEETIIAAAGTSCRHQIKDGTGREARHPVEILWEALKKD